MRLVAVLFALMLTFVAFSGCDKETQAAEPSSADSAQPTEQQTAEGVEVAKPVQQANSVDPAAMAPDAVVVTVNGDPITNAQVNQEVQKRIEVMKQQMPEGQTMSDAQKQQIRVGVTNMLVQKKVLDQMLAKKNVTVTDDEVMAAIAKAAEAQGQTLDDVKAEVTEYGMTMDDVKSQVLPQVQMQKLAEAYMNDPEMEKKAKEFYDQNPSYFEVPERVRASHVLIEVDPNASDEEKAAARKKAEEVLAKAKAGEDFAELAKQYSDDPGSKDIGGEYTFGRGEMVKPFEDVAFGLEPNEISDIVETQFGFHIIKLSEKIKAGKTPFEDVKERIISYLLQQQMKENAVVQYSEAEEALRQKVQQQQMLQQQMMQQLQQQMAQQQAQQAQQPADQTGTPPTAPAEE